jgi:hypothetical protein
MCPGPDIAITYSARDLGTGMTLEPPTG